MKTKSNAQPTAQLDLFPHVKPAPKPFRLTHARHDPNHCIIPGMFRAVHKHGGRKARVELIHQVSPDCKVEVKMFEPLGADDLRVLQGLVAMASVQDGAGMTLVGPNPESPKATELRNLLDMRGAASDMDACMVRCSYYEFAREIGYANPRNTEQIRACIERLYMVSFFIQEGPRRMAFRLLSRCGTDDRGLTVVLNPKLASAIMGGRHVRISMDEVRALRCDSARLIHQRLCAWVNPSTQVRVDMKKLLSYLWPDETAPTPGAFRKRCWIIRQAMQVIGQLPLWKTEEPAAGKFVITRT